jgi:hypothetical protein
MSTKIFSNLNTDQIQKIFRLLQFSPMPRKEKVMWVKLLPYMTDEQVNKFMNIMEFENNKITSLALNLLEKKTLEKKLN